MPAWETGSVDETKNDDKIGENEADKTIITEEYRKSKELAQKLTCQDKNAYIERLARNSQKAADKSNSREL